MVEAKIDTDKKIFFIVILVLIVVGIGRTYAYFSAKSTTSTETVNTGTLKLEVENDAILRAQNIAPINTSEIFDKATKLHFTINNTGTIDMNAKITLNVVSITEALKSNDFKWALYNGETKVVDGTFLNVTDKIEMTNSILIPKTTSQSYDLYIWIEETGFAQDDLQKGTLEAKITVDATQ